VSFSRAAVRRGVLLSRRGVIAVGRLAERPPFRVGFDAGLVGQVGQLLGAASGGHDLTPR
jgi:hypothetical protein